MYRRRIKRRSSYEDEIERALKASRTQYGYETYTFPYVQTHQYIPDFVFEDAGILVEAKGYFSPADRSKVLKAREAIEEAGWELRFVFQRASNKLNARSKTTYSGWCDKHGFVWAEGMIPREWYE